MNSCPCGYSGHPQKECRCTEQQIQRYRRKISGPLLDRFDLHIEVPAISLNELQNGRVEEGSAQVRARVAQARELAVGRAGCCNQWLEGNALANFCELQAGEKSMLENALQKLGMSARAYHRVLKVARTIADLGGSQRIASAHLMEALSFRMLDRQR